MKLTNPDIEVLAELREVLEDEGYELHNVQLGGFNTNSGERSTEVDCTVTKTTTEDSSL